TNGNHEIMLGVKSGKAIRFHEEKVRAIGRTGGGVKGVTFRKKDDVVVGAISMENQENDVLVVSENGYGKRSSIENYRITNRGGKGVKTINITDKTGNLIGVKSVDDESDLMIITKNGTAIRLSVSKLRVMGRATQGVRLINLREGDAIAAIAKVPSTMDNGDMEEGFENGEIEGGESASNENSE
ncbi:MAG: DNA gyrase subunit A, partial [Bacteroidales bacterium]|nr:DNA gyrase subunit A [Bacteroidales bacterium]